MKKAGSGQRWVIKIGSALLTNNGQGLNRPGIKSWVEQISKIRQSGIEVVLVSSGAVAEGLARLGISVRPDNMAQLQGAAAVGQMGLVQAYESEFNHCGIATAQVLMTHDDLSNRQRYLNARAALRQLLAWQVVPVVNENDSVVTDEIRFGDNDTLAALVANLVEADRLVLMTDQSGLFDSDPRKNPSAVLLERASVSDARLDGYAKPSGGNLGRGGMLTKLRAARLAARSGANTHIVDGAADEILLRLAQGEKYGTVLVAETEKIAAKKQWLMAQLQCRGELVLDRGAARNLLHKGSSLLAVGVFRLRGDFGRGDLVRCMDESGVELARGLVNYSSEEAQKIIGKPSRDYLQALGFKAEDELMHRDNLVLTEAQMKATKKGP